MARPSATAALLLLLLSLLVVAHCRTVAVAEDHAAVAVNDENGLSSNPTLPAQAGTSAIIDEEALRLRLRLPSHRLHLHLAVADADGHDGELAAWKKKMLRRWFYLAYLCVHRGMRRHRLHHVHHDQEEEESTPEAESMNMKRFHFHHHDKEKNKRLRPEHGEDSYDDDEQVEETVRRFSDKNGLSSNPTLPAEAGASATDEEEALPAEQQQHDFEFLRLPSQRLHRPCRLHHHLWWKRHHGVYRDAPRKPVAEPDLDRSLPDSDGEGELVASREPSSFADADGHDGKRAVAVIRARKKEMLRRWFHFHFNHGMHRRHRPHHVHHDEEGHEQDNENNMKRFHFHHHDEEDKEKNMARTLRQAEHGEDSDDEDEEVEEMVRRCRKAIMRRRFGHGGRRSFHHLHHDHTHEEAEKQQAGGAEQSGVMAWIKGLMNRF